MPAKTAQSSIARLQRESIECQRNIFPLNVQSGKDMFQGEARYIYAHTKTHAIPGKNNAAINYAFPLSPYIESYDSFVISPFLCSVDINGTNELYACC